MDEPEHNKANESTQLLHPLVINPERVQRILVCQLRQIGDVLLSTPSIELLAKKFPRAELHVYTEKGCAPMLYNNPFIHRLWELDKAKLKTPWQQAAFYYKVARNNFDIVVNFQHLPRCTWVVALSGAPVRIGPTGPLLTRWLYTRQTQPKPAYAAGFKAEVLAPLGIQWNGDPPRLYLSEEEMRYADALIKEMGLSGKRFISIDATHRHKVRRWPTRHFARLMDMISSVLPDMHFLLTYGPDEKDYAENLLAACRNRQNVAMLPSVQTLRHVAACMAHATMHIGNCSAPRHMATALDVPTFTILGASGTGWTFPSPQHRHLQLRELRSLPCQNCNKSECPANLECLNDLTPELVFPLVMDHLHKYGKDKGDR